MRPHYSPRDPWQLVVGWERGCHFLSGVGTDKLLVLQKGGVGLDGKEKGFSRSREQMREGWR